MAARHVPTKPELDQHPNGLRLVRYPLKTKRGKTVARNYKIGFMPLEEAEAQFKIFMDQWSKMNGTGPAGVVAALEAKRKHKGGLPAVIDPKVKKGKPFKLTDEQREKARNAYHAKKNGKPGKAGSPDISQMKDMVGVMVASLSAVSTSLKMLQDQLERMQH